MDEKHRKHKNMWADTYYAQPMFIISRNQDHIALLKYAFNDFHLYIWH